ncbi:glycosyltransferase family 2 protein [Helicobacter sp. 11S02629-2]|uniref:glycosyltransferase family 2 protein n=1 Tax=Helicobacter sp. 11S02629-2 TaxID=1476195 RepID=UPI000BA67DDF|nr:glycosyltransferase family 2 protein [Helicobacter sp. 11S02629-2]PAF45678.1 hypothetical protein BKH40_02010 [Helicobacter sp. 11S02629-2]
MIASRGGGGGNLSPREMNLDNLDNSSASSTLKQASLLDKARLEESKIESGVKSKAKEIRFKNLDLASPSFIESCKEALLEYNKALEHPSALVSLIVSNYNNKAYIDECINSLREQSFKELEIIIVDDASSDDSLTLLKKHADEDKRIRLFESKQRSGHPSLARNYGVSIAKGEYIAFVDSDDYLALDCVESHLKAIESSDADMAYCVNNIYNEAKDEYTHSPFRARHASKTGALVFKASEANSNFWRHFNAGACFKMYKKEFFLKEGLCFQDCDFEDTDVSFIAFACAKKICFVPRLLYTARMNKRYGVNRGNMDSTIAKLSNPLDGIRIITRSYEVIKQRGIKGLEEGLLYAYFDVCTYYLNFFTEESNLFDSLREARELLASVLRDNPDIRYIYFKSGEKKLLFMLLDATPLKFIVECMVSIRCGAYGSLKERLLNGIDKSKYQNYPKPMKLIIYSYKIFIRLLRRKSCF